ncbi:MAG TPA: YncE family protein [Ktedonobacterales bacterium]|nr:YncE family protein [Ktedonobacterales bacterium]
MLGQGDYHLHARPSRRPARALRGPLLVLACVALLVLAGCGGHATAGPSLPILQLPAPLAGYHIFVSDLQTGDVAELGTRTTHVSESVHGLGLSADGHTLYVTDISGNRLVAFDLKQGNLTTTTTPHSAPVGVSPVHMVNTLDGRAVLVTNFGVNTVTVVNTATWTPEATLTVGVQPHGIVLSPDGTRAYVSCYGGASIAIIDVTRMRVERLIALPAGAEPYGIASSGDGRYVYASDNLTGRLFVLDTRAETLLPSVKVGLHPALIVRSPDGKTLYVANGGSRDVSVLDIARDPSHPIMRASVTVTGYPHGIAVTPDGRYVIVADTIGQNLAVIDTTSDTLIATIPAEKYPNDVLVAP